MSLAAIRVAMKTAIESVASIGIVTDFEPYTARQEDFETYFKPDGAAYVQGWTITRETTTERGSWTDGNARAHLMVVRGYRTVKDEATTEKAFQDLIEAVCARLRREMRDQYGGLCMVGPPSVRITEARNFNGYLVHYVEITQTCTEQPVVIAP